MTPVSPLDQSLQEFGADLESLRRFDRDGPELLPYATLMRARGASDPAVQALYGVVEWQRSPLAFVVDGDALGDDPARLQAMRRLLAMRGDGPYLVIARQGTLDVHAIALDARAPQSSRLERSTLDGDAASLFPRLANLRPGLPEAKGGWVSDVVLELLGDSIDRLKATGNVGDEEAISLVGRALFTRFLADRDLVPDTWTAGLSGTHELFDNAAVAVGTSERLDRTFNGNFLPLPSRRYQTLRRAAFGILGNIMRRSRGDSQLFLGWEAKWDHLDFAHIPVGVLSQAYELYLRKHAKDRQEKEGGFYTPRPIAEVMVSGALQALDAEGSRGDDPIRVLDPSAGAGVFLLTAFRELVAGRWRSHGARPDTRALRDVLYRQIVGFDINEAALRFAALGLYLLSIELDPHPKPVQKLRFRDLRGLVLHKVGTDSGASPSRLGSLGPDVPQSHVGQYDIVIGNPPWAHSTKLPHWNLVLGKVAEIARSRLPAGSPGPPLPNEVLDLPFVWRAMEWAKRDAAIAFALHARVLFAQGDGMPQARRALFRALDVVGVVNGAELRQTSVWPNVAAPFCLLFAKNRPAGPASGFRFVTPRLESRLNGGGQMRIDARAASLVSPDQIEEQPTLLKTLFRGGESDLQLYRKIASQGLSSLDQHWSRDPAVGAMGNGYQRFRASSRVNQKGDGAPGNLSDFLVTLPDFRPGTEDGLLIDVGGMSPFRETRVHRRRSRDIYRAPLLLVQESPRAADGRIRVFVTEADVAFSESVYGYSAAVHPDGRALVRYLSLVLSSRVALWLALMASGKFGVERDTLEKATIDALPLPSFWELGAEQRRRVDALFDRVAVSPSRADWGALDSWACELYGLREREAQVVRDTLAFSLPFAAVRHDAEAPPGREAVDAFCAALEAELRPWGVRYQKRFSVRAVAPPKDPLDPWLGVEVQSEGEAAARAAWFQDDALWREVVRLADRLAATEIVMPGRRNNLVIGRLGQARYWTVTQARETARRVVWNHVEFLSGQAA